MPGLLLSIATAILALACFGLTLSLIHLRRRHRDMRSTLHRVVRERDDARWEKARSQ